jgi:hypothetical protein
VGCPAGVKLIPLRIAKNRRRRDKNAAGQSGKLRVEISPAGK